MRPNKSAGSTLSDERILKAQSKRRSASFRLWITILLLVRLQRGNAFVMQPSSESKNLNNIQQRQQRPQEQRNHERILQRKPYDDSHRRRRFVALHAQAGNTDGSNTALKTRKKTKRSKKTKQKAKRPNSFDPTASLPIAQYTVLSREEEQRLFLLVVQARDVRDKLTELIVLKQQEASYDTDESILSDEEYYDTYYDWNGNDDLLPGCIPKYHLLEQHHRESFLERAETDALWEDEDDPSRDENIVWDDSWHQFDGIIRSRSTEEQMQYDTELINDDDIVNHVGLQGGRPELLQVLRAGALARDELIRCNLKLVSSTALRFSRISNKRAGNPTWSMYTDGWGRPGLHEAFQEGVEGLITAVERFEPKRGLKFSTFATLWITNHVRRCFQTASSGALRLPTNVYDRKAQFLSIVKSYHDQGEEVPPLATIANRMGVTEKRLSLILRVTKPLQSLDSLARKANPLGYVDGTTIADELRDESEDPEEQVDLSLLRQSLESVMAGVLAPHERDVLRLRLGLDDGIDRSLSEVASFYDGRLTQKEVGRTEKFALQKLRTPAVLETYHLDEYFNNSKDR